MERHSGLENVMAHLGDFGTYQFRQLLLYFLASMTAGIHMFSLQVVAAVPDHRCRIPNVDLVPTTNFSVPDLETYIPQPKDGRYDSCHMFNLTDDNNTIIQCESWVYDTTYHKSSRGIEWNFVCDRKWMGVLAQSTFLFGVLVGVVTLGLAADKYGRKTIICWSAVFQLIFGVAAAFAPEYYTFLIVQFFYGAFGAAGCYMPIFVLCMEQVGPRRRTICGMSLLALFAVGIMLVGAWGLLIPDRRLLQLVYGLHAIFLLGHWWLLDESIRWLWANGRISDAIKIAQKGLKINGSSIQLDPDEYLSTAKTVQEDSSTANLFDLFKTPVLRKRTLNICFSWFTNSLLYHVLSLSTGKLYGNPFVLICLIGVVELPSYAIAVLLMDRIGRRFLTFLFMILGGICCIIATYSFKGSIVNIAIVMIGKFSIATSFAILYNYSAELFPTVVRNSAMGLVGMCARLSVILTPFVYLLDHFISAVAITIFGTFSLISGFLILFLPETIGCTLPQTIEDSENFSNPFSIFSKCYKGRDVVNNENSSEQMQPLNH